VVQSVMETNMKNIYCQNLISASATSLRLTTKRKNSLKGVCFVFVVPRTGLESYRLRIGLESSRSRSSSWIYSSFQVRHRSRSIDFFWAQKKTAEAVFSCAQDWT
jgi:hypothetical protein